MLVNALILPILLSLGPLYRCQWDEKSFVTLHFHETPVWSIAFASDGKSLASSSEGGVMALWDLENMRLSRTLTRGGRSERELAFSPNGKGLFFRSDGVAVWPQGSNEVRMLRKDAMTQSGVAHCTDASWFYEHDATSGILSVFDERERKISLRLAKDEKVGLVAVDDAHRVMAVGDVEQRVRLFDFKGNQLHKLARPKCVLTALKFSRDGALLASSGFDGRVIVWNVKTGNVLFVIDHEDAVFGFSFTPDSKLLAIGVANKTVSLWDLSKGRKVASLPHPALVLDVCITNDGARMAVAGGDIIDNGESCEIRVWDLPRVLKRIK